MKKIFLFTLFFVFCLSASAFCAHVDTLFLEVEVDIADTEDIDINCEGRPIYGESDHLVLTATYCAGDWEIYDETDNEEVASGEWDCYNEEDGGFTSRGFDLYAQHSYKLTFTITSSNTGQQRSPEAAGDN